MVATVVRHKDDNKYEDETRWKQLMAFLKAGLPEETISVLLESFKERGEFGCGDTIHGYS